MTQKSRPRIAVVGAGVYGSAMLKCFAALHKQGLLDLVALAEIDKEILDRQAKSFAIRGYADYRDMFTHAGLDAVAVATPDHLHGEVVLAAADAGLHVLVQKPLDTRSARAQQMIAACRQRAVMLFIDFHKRFDPAHMRLKSDMQAGRLGKIQYGSVCMEDKIVVPSVWLRQWAARSSPSWFLGVHFYDLVYWLLQSQPRRVYATGHRGKLQSMGVDTLDSVNARVEFANGASFSFDLSWILPTGFPSIVNQQIRMVGEEGVVEVDSQDRGMFSCYADVPESLVINAFGAQEYEHPVWGAQVQGYTFASMIRFVELLRAMQSGVLTLDELKGKYPDGEDALVSTRIGEAVDRSMACGEWISL
ncbi:Gfo/Idh/MocA family oxidoreductase [Verminephrobacter aporrectodeae]|uniref:Gfo/Idh/MocA family oxidoreductase n=1 Tax=Verminephrobacter aporrectodeae TaxID=1110389 RepID=UPI0002375AED|nr:Gfo/Idh/MocA family oxidoreductase [Verminephrobacter aporrectodeae]